MFDDFLGSFTDAQLDLEKFRREKEQEEKRAKAEAQVESFITSLNVMLPLKMKE